MKLYKYYLKMHFKSRMQYKTSFVLFCIAQLFLFFTYYFVIFSLFQKFSNLKGFTISEVTLVFGIINFGYSFNEVFFRGIDQFAKLIVRGEFDRLLLRPKNILLQVFGFEIGYERIIKLIQSTILIIIALVGLKIEFTFLKFLTLIFMLMGSIVIFFGLFLLGAAFCFVTIEGLEFINLFTDGGKYMAMYPISIYKKVFIIIFTFIIPYAFVNYYPLMYLLGKNNNHIFVITPFITFIYLIPCFILFNLGIKKYSSVGS